MHRVILTLLLALLSQAGLAQDQSAPSFTLADADGNQLTLPRAHEGVDIYFFWASWCPYCKALMPYLQGMRTDYGDAVTVYALNIRDEEDPEIFMLEHEYDFILVPEADSVMALYGIEPVPALYLVDGQGIIRFNLYDMVFNDSPEFKAMSHGEKAGQRAPGWAAEIRKTIDQILGESGD